MKTDSGFEVYASGSRTNTGYRILSNSVNSTSAPARTDNIRNYSFRKN